MHFLDLLDWKADEIMATQDEVIAMLGEMKTAADAIQAGVSQLLNAPVVVPATITDPLTALHDELKATAAAVTPAPPAA